VICEIMKDDGEMARLPDLQIFAAEHGLKIGTIADLIAYRSRAETLVERRATKQLQTAWGEFTAHAYVDAPSQSLHLALVKGTWDAASSVLARVHEPLSVMDLLQTGRQSHSWSVDSAMQHIAQEGSGVVVLLNCGESSSDLLAQFQQTDALEANPRMASSSAMDLRTYGIGAQILRDCGVQKMTLMASPRRMPSMAGYGLEVTNYLQRKS
jgi:3,4-dihydroxy 2-butanone 4-phosphate synthase / GTP cyclohydrolase II